MLGKRSFIRASARLAVGALVFSLLANTAGASEWTTAAEEKVKILWKELLNTRLQVWAGQPHPADGDILDPEYAKRIEIEYGLGISAERFRNMTQEAIESNYAEAQWQAYAGEIAEFSSWYLPVEKGDRYRLSWEPGNGLQLRHNEAVLGVLKSPEASALILSIWLGPAAVDEKVRDKMLAEWSAGAELASSLNVK